MTPRLKAFLIHLGFSVLIALVAAAVVFFIWYLSPLHTAVGVTGIFLMLLLIDVTLGPLLTLLVYKPGKKTLLMDLTVIACLQLAALVYGLYSVAEGRPAWLVFATDRFELVRNNDIDQRQSDEALPQYRQPSWFGPQWAIAITPDDIDSRNEILFEAVLAGVDLAQRPNLYQSLEQHRDRISQRIRTLIELNEFNLATRVQNILQAHPQADGWLPLSANQQDMVVLMQRDSAEVVAIVDLRPW